MSELKSVEEHNREVSERESRRKGIKNGTGLACPKCGEELYWSDNATLLTAPPQKRVQCNKCNHKQTVFV